MPSKNNVWGCSLNVFVNVLLLVRPCLLIQTDRHCNLGTAKNFAQVGGKFSLTTVVRIGCQVVSLSTCNGFWHQDWSFISQVIERLRAVHEVGLVYRWGILEQRLHFETPVDIHSLSLVLLCKLRCIYKMHIFSRDVKPANLLFFCSPAICLFVAFVTVCLFLCLFCYFVHMSTITSISWTGMWSQKTCWLVLLELLPSQSFTWFPIFNTNVFVQLCVQTRRMKLQVDFGLATPYKDERGAHIPSFKQHLLTGTPRWSFHTLM